MVKYGVIFDMDGVLVDSYRAHFDSWNRMAGAHGLEMTEQQFAATFGRTTREIIASLWSDHVSEAEVPAWDDEKEAAYRDILRESFPEMPGAAALIEALHAEGFALAIGSSGPPENVAVVRECLPPVFGAVVTAVDVTRGKPHPEVFLKAADKLQIRPLRCAVVEDAPAGVEAARSAGMAAVALTGTAPWDKLAKQAHLVVDALGDLTPERIGTLIDTHAP